jgi:excisionase family DNA binding protein
MTYLTLKQVKEQLNVSERTVFRLMDEEELHPFKMGKSWRFDQEDIDAYIAKLRQETEVRRGRKRGTGKESEITAVSLESKE